MSADSQPQQPDSDQPLLIPWSDVVRFVRQLSHDLRNNLNAIELQSAYLNELVENAEARDEVKRLRAMASELGANLQKVTSAMGAVTLHSMPYKAGEFIEDLRQKLAAEFPNAIQRVEWSIGAIDADLEIDPQLLQQALVELFTNAFRHAGDDVKLVAQAKIEGDKFLFELREPKIDFEESTDDWGRRPFQKVSHGQYGLGLYRARAILEAHSGSLMARYDPAASVLVTTITLPLSETANG